MCILADRTTSNNNQLSGGTEGASISPCTCPTGNVDGETQTDVVVVDLGVRMRSSYSDEEDDDGRDRQSHWKRIKTRSESHSDAAGERFRFMGHSRESSHSHDRSLGGGGGGGRRLLLLPTQKGNAADQHQQQRQASRRMFLEKIAGSRHLSSYDDNELGDRRRTGSIIKGWDVSSMGRGGHHQHSDGGTNINTTCKKDTDYSRAVMKRKHTEAASSSVDDGNRRRISSPEHHNSRVMMYHGGSMIMTSREDNNKHMARRHFVDTAATQGHRTRVSSSCSSGVAGVGRFNGEDQIHFVEDFGHSDDDGDDDDGFVSIRREKARIVTQDLRETLNARLRRSESLKRENLNNRVEFVVDDLLLKRGPPKGGGIQLRSNGTVTQGSLVKKLPSNCDRSRRPVDDDCQGFAKTTGSGSLGLERSKADMESDERHRKEKGRTRWAEKERDDLEKENLAKAAAEVKSVTVVDYSHKFTVAKAPASKTSLLLRILLLSRRVFSVITKPEESSAKTNFQSLFRKRPLMAQISLSAT